MNAAAIQARLVELATDAGYLKRRAEPGSTIELLADRIAGHIEAIHGMVHLSAAELAACSAPGDAAAIDEAIHAVDEGWAKLQALLRRPT